MLILHRTTEFIDITTQYYVPALLMVCSAGQMAQFEQQQLELPFLDSTNTRSEQKLVLQLLEYNYYSTTAYYVQTEVSLLVPLKKETM